MKHPNILSVSETPIEDEKAIGFVTERVECSI